MFLALHGEGTAGVEAAALAVGDGDGFGALETGRVELGVEVRGVFGEGLVELVEDVHEDVGVDVFVEVLDLDAEAFLEGHGEFGEEAAAGHAEVVGGEVGGFAEADAEEVAHGGFNGGGGGVVPVEA